MKMNSGAGEAMASMDTSTNNISATESDESLANAMPKDAQVMVAILKDMGITDWEPRVISQMLEFSYNYVTSVLEDAKMVSSHARKKAVDADDVQLAVQMITERTVTVPPSRDLLLEVARSKNSSSLPVPRPNSGLRLPPDRFCLTGCNYKLRSARKRQPAQAGRSSSAAAPPAKFSMQARSAASVGAQPVFKMTAAGNPAGGPNKIQIRPTTMSAAPGGPAAMFTMTVNHQGGQMAKRNDMS